MKAIETTYNGYKFRSRLEARWAVFLDSLKIKYEYEPEGFELGDGVRYLPDFYLPELKYWLEIKPTGDIPERDREKHKTFAREMKNDEHFFVIVGTPGVSYDRHSPQLTYDAECFWYWDNSEEEFAWDYPYHWCRCSACGVIEMQFSGRIERAKHKEWCEVGGMHKVYAHDEPLLVAALTTARQARFEHGYRTEIQPQ